MMADDKPFECTQPGCGMRFANEDHLSVHQTKHEMSLCLSSSSSRGACFLTFVADQTPTPTKFLRNCEEMGLFHELSKNPFEEAFKKASEETKSLDLHESSSLYPATSIDSTDSLTDILNTPTPLDTLKREAVRSLCCFRTASLRSPSTHASSVPSITVSPSNIQHCDNFPLPGPSHDTGSTITATCNSGCCDDAVCTVSMATSSSASVSTASAADVDSESSEKTLYLQVMITSPSGEIIPVHIPATAVHHTPANTCQSVATTTVSTGVTMSTKQRLKAAIHNNLQAGLLHRNMQVMSQAVEWITANEAASTSHSQEPNSTTTITTTTTTNAVNQCNSSQQNTAMHDDGQRQDTVIRASDADVQRQDADTSTPLKRRLSSASDDDLDDRRRKFLERNRAAAARCRYKKKAWMSNLEQRADDVQTTNTFLQAEVVKLRQELSQLKQMFLAHQDCPITQRQRLLISSVSRSCTAADNSKSTLPTNNTLPTGSTVPTANVVPTGSLVPTLGLVPLVKSEVSGSLTVSDELFVTTALNTESQQTQ